MDRETSYRLKLFSSYLVFGSLFKFLANRIPFDQLIELTEPSAIQLLDYSVAFLTNALSGVAAYGFTRKVLNKDEVYLKQKYALVPGSASLATYALLQMLTTDDIPQMLVDIAPELVGATTLTLSGMLY